MSQKRGRRRKSRILRLIPVVILIIFISFLISIATEWSFVYIFLSVFIAYMALYFYMMAKYRRKAAQRRKNTTTESQAVHHLAPGRFAEKTGPGPVRRKFHVSNVTLKKLQNDYFSSSGRTVLRKMPKASYDNQSNLVKAKNPFDIIKAADFDKKGIQAAAFQKENTPNNKKEDMTQDNRISWRDLYARENNEDKKVLKNEIKQEEAKEDISTVYPVEENINAAEEKKSDIGLNEEKQDNKSNYNELFIDMEYPDSIDDEETKSIISRLDKLLKKKPELSVHTAARLKNIDENIVQEEKGEEFVKVDNNILDQIYNEKTEPSRAPGSRGKNIKKPVEFLKNKVFKDAFMDEDENMEDDEEEGQYFEQQNTALEIRQEEADYSDYSLPVDILKAPVKKNSNLSSIEIKNNAEKLIETFSSFGVGAKIVNISRGPSVTRYEIQPDTGVKVSRIVNLADDIALNLASSGVRIEAPIPGKAAVGIEVPNKEIDIVQLYEIINSDEFSSHKSRLAFAVGKDVSGKIIVGDIQKMPHILIAGATGSGKSVCINTLITSILYKASPKDVRMIMIDPKVVELNIYNGIPHLMIPVVTNPKKAAGALGWAVNEMERRYNLFAEKNVRDIRSYNKTIRERKAEPLPLIVIIIDELADLMMVASNDVEDYICRLAQKARAAGIHLVVATQRPSVDVITGLIKANIPSRIAFAVSSQVDSRTIIDMAGAEKLLGRGDMLYYPMGEPKPIRVQGAFVSDQEIEDLVDYIKNAYGTAQYSNEVLDFIEQKSSGNREASAGFMDDEDDSLLSQAIKLVIDHGNASVSFLQRKLKIGYSRAARLIDRMEEMGIVSAGDGSKPRQVLITAQEWEEYNM